MVPIDEMILKFHQGAFVDMISRQFDLTRDQTVAAIEALMPAFRESFKRSAATPEGQLSFLKALVEAGQSRMLQSPANLFKPEAMAEGKALLDRLFGSSEASRIVAAHASRMAAVNSDTLQKILPALALLLMGGLSRQMGGEKTPGDKDPFFPASAADVTVSHRVYTGIGIFLREWRAAVHCRNVWRFPQSLDCGQVAGGPAAQGQEGSSPGYGRHSRRIFQIRTRGTRGICPHDRFHLRGQAR